MASAGGREGEPRLVSVNLAGSPFTIRTDASQEYVSRLEEYVNDKLGEIQPSGSRLSVRSALALAALSIADDYFTAAEGRDETERIVREKLKKVLTRVDAALDPSEEK